MSLLEIATRAVDEKGAMQKPTELAALLAITRSLDPAVIWEIGTATGGTLWALASLLGPGRTYVSIDLPEGLHGAAHAATADELAELVNDGAWPCSLEIIRGDSHVVDLPEEPPNLVLLDGDHSAPGVRADWERFAPLVPAGGAVALHDILKHSKEAIAAGVNVDVVWAELVKSEPRTAELVDRRPRPGRGRWSGQWGGWGIVFR